MNSVVLSGNRTIVLSGNGLSCYQAQKTAENSITARSCAPSNITNLNSLTFVKAAPFRWTTAERQKAPQPRRQKQPGHPQWRAAP
ncbi:hypothetical protein IPC18_05765 [Pseudomonas aeruginosa]|nr:hypothetical protein IPC18_05765 [Pseudomonas aeruginosa]